MKFNLVLMFLALTVLISCGESYLVEETTTFENQIWNYQNTVDYTFDNKDTTKTYSLYLDLTYNEDYYYQNIYVKVHTGFPSGRKVSDQVGIDLSEKSGKSNGSCSGDVCTVSNIVLVENVKLQELGKHTFTFEQFTRDEDLKGVKKLTFKIK